MRVSPIVVVLLLLVPAVASAGTIQLVLATRVSTDAGRVLVELDLRNDGDDTALALTPVVEFQGVLVSGETIPELGPSMARTVNLVVVAGVGQRGRWPVIIRVRYADAALSRFEAVHVDVVGAGVEVAGSAPRVDVPDVRVATETTARADVDPGGLNVPVQLTFVTPAGVVVTPRSHLVEAGSRGEQVPLTVRNLTATLASRLPMVAVAEFERDGVHETVTFVSVIEIGPPLNDSRMLVIAFLLVASLLAWATIATVVVRRSRTRDGRR